jgi:hypothetical protein
MVPHRCHGRSVFHVVITFLAIHFGVYAVARGVGENLECFVESFLFRRREVGTRIQTFSFFNYNFEKVARPWVYFDLASQFQWSQTRQNTGRKSALRSSRMNYAFIEVAAARLLFSEARVRTASSKMGRKEHSFH